MTKNHMKRIAAPRTWPVARKLAKFITRPNPGAHNLNTSMPLSVILKELLGVANTSKEVRYIVFDKGMTVNGRKVTDPKMPVGFMDVIEFGETKECYRIVLNEKGKLSIVGIKGDESKFRPSKIKNKRMAKGGKIQLNFFNGWSLFVEKDAYATGDTLLLTIPENQVKEHIPLKEGVMVYLTGGRHIGKVGKLVSISGRRMTFELSDKQHYETMKRYAFPIGKDKPAIKIKSE